MFKMINYSDYLVLFQKFLIGFLFPIGIIFLFYGYISEGIGSIIISSAAYFIERRRLARIANKK